MEFELEFELELELESELILFYSKDSEQILLSEFRTTTKHKNHSTSELSISEQEAAIPNTEDSEPDFLSW